MFIPDGHLTNDRIGKCTRYINELLQPVIREINSIGYDKCAGSSGTIMSSAFIIRALKGQPPSDTYTLNNFTFLKEEFELIEKIILQKSSPEERKLIPGIDDGREDIIPAGILILSSLIKMLLIEEITVSSYAIREGIILDSIGK